MYAISTKVASDLKAIKSHLESIGSLNKSRKIDRDGDTFHIYTTLTSRPSDDYLASLDLVYTVYEQNVPRDLASHVTTYLHNIEGLPHLEPLLLVLPKKWSIYPPMLLLGPNTFDAAPWQNASDHMDMAPFFKHFLTYEPFAGLTHIAINKPIIESDIMRRPFNIRPVYGDFGPAPDDGSYNNPTQADFDNAFWCSVNQNGIRQHWAPQYTMFSRGNIKEKSRVLQYKNLANTLVFDLYCGIGYFSLSYLHNGAKLMCWEINAWSVEGFTRALGKYKYKVIRRHEPFDYETYLHLDATVFIFQESNEYVGDRLATFPSLNISHINLGLLPSSQNSWPTTNWLLNKSVATTTVHVHENVHINEFDRFRALVAATFGGQVVHLEKVKTFAPDVWHIVVDVVKPV